MNTYTQTFEADTGKILNIVINSLYSDRDIFLRELLSNASDAIQKRKFLGQTDQSLLNNEADSIEIIINKKKKTIQIIDMQKKKTGKLFNFCFKAVGIIANKSIEEKKSLKVKKRFSSNSFIIKDYKASTVILSHGSGGVWKHTYMWKDRLNNQGYNVVIIDHHKEKGVKPHVGRRDYKDFPEERVKDLLKLSRWIKKQKWNKGIYWIRPI